MRYQLFGGLQVFDRGRAVDLGGPKQRAVLAALLVDLGRPVSAGLLVDRVWGDNPPASADASLQAYVSNLRRALEPGRAPRTAATTLLTRPTGYTLLAARDDVDLARFEDGATRGHGLLVGGDDLAAAGTLDLALAEWIGPVLPELVGLPWVDDEATRLGQLRSQVRDDRFEAGLRLGEHVELIPRIHAAIAEEPFRERLRAQLALALYRAGRQREALGALSAARAALVEEVGVDPGQELRQLEADILAQSPSLDLAPPTAPRPTAHPAPAPTSAAADRRAPTDAAIDRSERVDLFVGRDAELAALLAAYTAVRGGGGRVAVVHGQAGIGKTRLIEELAARVPDAALAWARCPESAAQTPYGPWTQVGRQLDGAGALDEPLLASLAPPDDARAGDAPAADRLALHLAVVGALTTAQRPVVIVVDDLHWADPASLRLVEFAAGELRRTSVLLVVTTRPVPPDAPGALVDCLAELARQAGPAWIDLGGLSGSDVERWLATRTGTADPEVAEVVHGRTLGNPFFIGEVVELLASEGHLTDAAAAARTQVVPAAVQVAIRRRVGRLPAGAQQLLAAASVVGRRFDVDVLAAVTDQEPVDALDTLAPCLAAGFVEETELPYRFQFSHALVAEALEAELNAGRRARLHAATTHALAHLRANDTAAHLAQLAYHAFEGAAAGTAELAYEWSVAAARQAVDRLAHDDAAEHWGRAARALELSRPGDRAAMAETLVEQGIAHVKVDDIAAGFTALVAAIELAISLGDAALLARATSAMNVAGVWQVAEVSVDGVDVVAALDRAIAALPEGMATERALALGALVDAAYWRWPPDRLDEVSAKAVEIARRVGDRELLARTLQKRTQALWMAARVDARGRACAELLELADADLPPEAEAIARFAGAVGLWDRGETAATRFQVERARALGADRAGPALITQLDSFMAAIAAVTGRLAECEEYTERTYALYRTTRRWAAEANRAGFLVTAWTDQDRLADIRAVAPAMLDSPYRPFYKEVYGLALTEYGELDEAAEVCAELPPLVDCWLHAGIVAVAAHVRVALGDVAAVTTLRDLLVPLSGQMAVLGTGPAYGDIDLALATIARFLGDTDAARRHVDDSVALLTKADAGPYLARALLLRAALTGGERADADRRMAADIVRRLGLHLLAKRL